MASIYFYYNELLRQSADQAVSRGMSAQSTPDQYEELQQQAESSEKKQRGHPSDPEEQGNQDEDAALKMVLNTEATLAALQPRMNRLVYLHTSGNVNLEVLARSLGPKL
ncbi:hypothetical protein PF005_g12463 [Phytophthora fragariae]|nr:hypothetical protein PF009_g13652 [Phytophthora fragariae]KAE9108340.1 hypothetical protein PF007_g12686 [Phytophthora fragariae]KAE9143268.1 hypothetical protein PF006_g11679 [Phytophthora fragariae]KAE9207766.1 hypothetical protein PF005_g12463 [Phytophthora fragariae]KAE9227298.1 hypothetical protein PF002_g13859 [Phytophthora fragariae]